MVDILNIEIGRRIAGNLGLNAIQIDVECAFYKPKELGAAGLSASQMMIRSRYNQRKFPLNNFDQANTTIIHVIIMDLMREIGKNLMMGITGRSHFALVISIILISCQQVYDCNDFELKVKNQFSEHKSIDEISLSVYHDFNWDVLYIIEGPRIAEEVRSIIGLDSFNKDVSDDGRLYVFLNSNTVVSQSVSYCHDINFNTLNKEGYSKFHANDILTLHSREIGGIWNYYISKK